MKTERNDVRCSIADIISAIICYLHGAWCETGNTITHIGSTTSSATFILRCKTVWWTAYDVAKHKHIRLDSTNYTDRAKQNMW